MTEQTFDFSKRVSRARLTEFADLLKSLAEQIGFSVSSRGWCYILEQAGAIDKSQFDKVATWVNRCRFEGLLPVDFVAEETARAFTGIETPAQVSPVQDLGAWVEAAINAAERYAVDWWLHEEVYIQMLVEKVDLVTLFAPVCAEYHIPIANARGWSSMLQRADYTRRFQWAEDRGLRCVLLYCGDHDPAGLLISDRSRKNLDDLLDIVWTDGEPGYDPGNLTIERFGLNAGFIEEHGFSWIDNLITGSGRDLSDADHPHHLMPYVQDYLTNYGPRKCEANVLVTAPEVAQTLCRSAIERHLGGGALQRFERRRQDVRDYVAGFDAETGVLGMLDDVVKKVADEQDTWKRQGDDDAHV